jgi:uncharacterized protein (DUF302 family)
MLPFCFSKEIPVSFELVLKKLPVELRKKGFEILTTIRVDNEFKKHLGIEFKRYAIFGVTNLPLSYRALLKEENFGLLLTCNVIIYEKENSTIVGSLRPTQFVPLFQNELIYEGATMLERKLVEVLDIIGRKKFTREAKRISEEQPGFQRAVA